MSRTKQKQLERIAAGLLCAAMIFTSVSFGAQASDESGPIRFNFESGQLPPFTAYQSNVEKPIGNRTTEYNSTNRDIQKEGTYYLNTEEDKNGNYKDSMTGEFRSPLFSLTDTKVSFKIGGGTNDTETYVAICKADGSILKKSASPIQQYIFTDVTWDLSGIVTPEDVYYISIVDKATAGFGFVMFDDFKATGKVLDKFTEQTALSLGLSSEVYAEMRTKINAESIDWSKPEEAAAYLSKVDQLEAQFKSYLILQIGIADARIVQLVSDTNSLKNEIANKKTALSGKKVIFINRPQYSTDHHNTHNMFPNAPWEYNDGAFRAGGAVRVLDIDSGKVSTLMETSTGSYRDLDVSYDGKKILLSYRANVNDSYNIWEYTLSDDMTSIVDSKQLTAMRYAEDMDPMYMPSGNIIFSSTRDPKIVMCNRQCGFNLYRMEADGANIVRIANSTLAERPNDVLPDGRILYERWEYNDMNFGTAQALWTVNEDGTQQATYYGNNSPAGAAIDAKSIPDTQLVAAILGSCHDLAWGALAIIDRREGVDGKAAVLKTWPAEAINLVQDENSGDNVDAYWRGKISNKYEDPRPIDSNNILVTRTMSGDNSRTGLYHINIEEGSENLIYADSNAGWGTFDSAIIQPRAKEITLSEKRDYKDNVGTFFVQNVYEGAHMQGVAPGTVTTLRVVESMPKRYVTRGNDWEALGGTNGSVVATERAGVNWSSLEVKRVLGEVPVYSDGSAYFEVPQDKFVYFQLLDADGRMVQSMRSGTLVQSGEKTGCVGCHEDRRITPTMNNKSKTPIALQQNFTVVDGVGVNKPDKLRVYGDENEFTAYENTKNMNYLTEVQPIFTAKCLDCHGYDNAAGQLTLVPDKGVMFNASYVDLWRARGTSAPWNNYVGAIGAGPAAFTTAKAWGSYASPLVQAVFSDKHAQYLQSVGKTLTIAEKRKIAEWVDVNGTYYGDYACNYPNNPGGRSPLTRSELDSIPNGGLGWNFSSRENRAMPIYFDNPEQSPILKRWAVGSTAYNNTLNLIRTGQARLQANPDVDMPGYQMRAEEVWRTQFVEVRAQIEAKNRAAINSGTKRYDWDNETDIPTIPWPGWGA